MFSYCFKLFIFIFFDLSLISSYVFVSEDLGIVNMNNFNYLCTGGSFSVEGVNDSKDFGETAAGTTYLEVINFVTSLLYYFITISIDLHSNESDGLFRCRTTGNLEYCCSCIAPR